MTPLSVSILEELGKIDTPTICNAIELFEVRPRSAGYLDARIQACFPEFPPIVGFASTATFRSSEPPSGKSVYLALGEQVQSFSDLSGPAIVVFQDLDSPPAGATFGEIMCASYRSFGAQGLITSGAGRDLDQVHQLEFPVFTSGSICSHGYCHTPQLGVPVQVGGLTIYPDDLLHGDRNGITTIPKEIIAELAEVACEFISIEAAFLSVLKNGIPTLAVFNEARQELHEQTAALRQRVSRRKR